MIRNLIIAGLLLACAALPAQAKGVVQPYPPVKSTPPKSVAKATTLKTSVKAPAPAPTPVIAQTKPVTTSKTSAVPYSSKNNLAAAGMSPNLLVTSTSGASALTSASSCRPTSGHLARLTAYWAGEGDYYTGRGISSTGIRLHDGHCAVDPRIIPYGSIVDIPGLGKYLAVDTGSAVISREAAREAANTSEERSALVIDLYFEKRSEARQFAANGPKYAAITWTAPSASNLMTPDLKNLVAEEDWNKLRAKQL